MLKIAILGYSSDQVGKWDPSNTEKGLPGSEECAVYASQELANLGHSVTVYMNPPENTAYSQTNPKWVSEKLWTDPDNLEKYDLVVLWRRFDPHIGKIRGKLVFFWPHDSPHPNFYPDLSGYDGVCVLSDHHRKQLAVYPGFSGLPYTICGNGILLDQFTSPMSFTNHHSVGYFSNYSRGLELLISIWPIIKGTYPEATLDIYYGRETWNTMSEESMNRLLDLIEKYKNYGVTQCGKVGHIELAQAMQKTSIWAYPCNTYAETFCITATKCQAAGCIPITTRIGALNETVHVEAPSMPIIKNEDDVNQYIRLLLETMERAGTSDTIEERKKYIEFAKTFSWSNCVKKWLELYSELSAK